MQNLTKKVKTCHGYDIYELTEEENFELRPGTGRTDTTIRSYHPKKTFFFFEQGENLATSNPVIVCRELPRATTYCRHYSRIPLNNKLSIEELKNLPLHEWVWVEVLRPFDCTEKVSSYYRKCGDCSSERAFCCGYPGLSFSFDYADYGTVWEAYRYRPD